MLGVHFGAGNIGRGFIGKLLSEANYRTCFVDVNEEIIRLLNEKESYQVFYAEEEKRSFTITNVYGINSATNPDDVVEAIASANIVTTAVGTNILPIIAKLIARGLVKRVEENNQPLNIIACENAIGGTDILKKAILSELDGEYHEKVLEMVGFPNAAVDRIVPNQTQENPLDVMVEPFFEWVVEKKAIKGAVPPIEGIHYVDNLNAYIERKLYTVNTGHAVTAYLGYLEGKKTVQEALEDSEIRNAVYKALRETGKLMVDKYDFDQQAHEAYIEKIIGRFTNPFIIDDVTRVARNPIKKLGYNERLISPARQLLERDIYPEGLLVGIKAALHYNFEGDEEAVELQRKIKEQGVQKALAEISGIEEDSPIVVGCL
ncbi:mannitol-1-phosphate 5-dehydrogenase [Evansella vedderi]|uniref:Mannitol-1-phosphate 5-dehydrogenase n=1 Tax=Evansella vedderi TaxID=38282 RepID=A0ABT9ZP45_9BACI|nr:mannitol-1-phosphate 5-dehydrogenase [Evansella vedderi]MDQ0252964.1 mannitol-1-phosphate 5-dehydrogenase [Evansella vedderi]